MLTNLGQYHTFCLSIEAVHHLRRIRRQWTTARHGKAVEHFRHIGRLYAGDALAERASYRANFRGAYEMSASGRIALAEHLRKALDRISFPGADPGDLSSMLVTDFTMAETGISHHLPQFDGSRRHTRAGVPLAGVDRLADGHCHVRRTAGS